MYHVLGRRTPSCVMPTIRLKGLGGVRCARRKGAQFPCDRRTAIARRTVSDCLGSTGVLAFKGCVVRADRAGCWISSWRLELFRAHRRDCARHSTTHRTSSFKRQRQSGGTVRTVGRARATKLERAPGQRSSTRKETSSCLLFLFTRRSCDSQLH